MLIAGDIGGTKTDLAIYSIETAVCARPLYIQEAFRLNWIGTWIRAMSER